MKILQHTYCYCLLLYMFLLMFIIFRFQHLYYVILSYLMLWYLIYYVCCFRDQPADFVADDEDVLEPDEEFYNTEDYPQQQLQPQEDTEFMAALRLNNIFSSRTVECVNDSVAPLAETKLTVFYWIIHEVFIHFFQLFYYLFFMAF